MDSLFTKKDDYINIKFVIIWKPLTNLETEALGNVKTSKHLFCQKINKVRSKVRSENKVIISIK